MRWSLLPILALGLQLAAVPAAEAGTPWKLPEPDACQPRGGLVYGPGEAPADVSATLPFKPGDVFGVDRLETLKRFLPDFLWTYRERFFFEGMRLEIGPCFRDYAPPAFFQAATEAGRGKASLDANGGLEGYGAGLPFAPDEIRADDPQAGLKWLWDVEYRYQGAGFRGKFRMTDLVGRVGRAEPFIGELFKVILNHRADRAAPDYKAAGARDRLFVAGGRFDEPFEAREYAWRQFRSVDNQREPRRSDDLHVYLPNFRRVRRLAANHVEGLYMPSFSVGVSATTQIPMGGGGGSQMGGGLAGSATAPGEGGTIQTKRSGWEGLELRPLLYEVEVLGLKDVLTPINSVRPGYPTDPGRAFGPWGLSFADDRWDLRRALVLELRARSGTGDEIHARQILYVDLQTLEPLYLATFDKKDEMTNVGMYVGRWSEDRKGYPRWPDDPERPVRVIDSVGVSFANLAEDGSWRRESWEVVSTPLSDAAIQRLLSVSQLTKGR